MELHIEARRGEEASQLLNNPMFREAVQNVESGIIHAMKQCDTQSSEQHKTLILSLQLLNQVVKQIRTVAETGRMAEMQLKKPMKDRVKAVFGR